MLEQLSEALKTPVGSLLEERDATGLTSAEADVLARWRRLDDRGRTALRHLLHYLTEPRS